MNVCGACGRDFSSVAGFDKHRVGVHAYTFAEGLRLEPPKDDGRRCLGEDELAEKGFAVDKHGRWQDTVAAERVRDAFSVPVAALQVTQDEPQAPETGDGQGQLSWEEA